MAFDIVNQVRSRVMPDRCTHEQALAHVEAELDKLTAFRDELAADPSAYVEHAEYRKNEDKKARIVAEAKRDGRNGRAALDEARKAGQIR